MTQKGGFLYREGDLQLQQNRCLQAEPTIWSTTDPSRPHCPPMWDGIVCWPSAPSGTLLTAPCPKYIVGFNHKQVASLLCADDGSWFVHPQTNNTWTNYTLCYAVDKSSEQTLVKRWLPVIQATSQAGYAASLITLLLACLVLCSSKRLRCPRNTLHMHLFFSFILRAVVYLLKDGLFVQGVGLPSDVEVKDGQVFFVRDSNNWTCKLLMSLWQYFVMANYTWILTEGLYLHNLIFLALFSDTGAIAGYVALGWGLPAVFVTLWALLRHYYEDTLCWTTHVNRAVFMAVRLPTIGSVLLSFALFLNIARVLLVKLRSSVSLERRRVRYRRWARSTLVLVPLFGAHYTLFLAMSYGAGPQSAAEVAWLFCDQLFASFQGCCVAVLYCLMNAEVRLELGRWWRSWWQRATKTSAPPEGFLLPSVIPGVGQEEQPRAMLSRPLEEESWL